MRAFQPGLCLRIHFYTGWQFFLFLLCPLRLRYDWRCQRFSRFPDANTNGNAYSYSYSDRNTNSDSNGNTHSYANRNPKRYTQAYSDAPAQTDASASPVGPGFSLNR